MEENKYLDQDGQEKVNSDTVDCEKEVSVDSETSNEQIEARTTTNRLLRPKYIIGFIAFAAVIIAFVVILVLALKANQNGMMDEDTGAEDDVVLDDGSDEGDDDYYSEGLEYKLSDDGEYYILSGIGTCEDVFVYVPAFYEDKPVTTIGTAAFQHNTNLIYVDLPETVSRIEAGAFNGCKSLRRIELHDSITYIGRDAFKTCVKLENKTVLDNMEYIGTTENPYLYLVEVQNGKSYDINPNTKVICSNAFSETLVSEIKIPEGVDAINYGAFAGCYMLKSVTIPKSLTVIEQDAFGDCASLEYNEFGNGLYIGTESNPYFALVGLKDATDDTLVINANTEIIADYAFYKQEDLKNVSIPAGLRIIGIHAFDRCSIARVYFEGSQSDWVQIEIRSNNLGFKNATIYFNSAG